MQNTLPFRMEGVVILIKTCLVFVHDRKNVVILILDLHMFVYARKKMQ